MEMEKEASLNSSDGNSQVAVTANHHRLRSVTTIGVFCDNFPVKQVDRCQAVYEDRCFYSLNVFNSNRCKEWTRNC
jgi:hypothetical protein